METAIARRFNVIDAVVLVGATGVGLGVARSTVLWYLSAGWSQVPVVVGFTALPWSWALVLLRLRRPRPGRRKIFSQPGFVACFAASIVTAFLTLNFLGNWLSEAIGGRFDPRETFEDEFYAYFYSYYAEVYLRVAPAVSASWLVLSLGGFWESEQSWVDRSGRVLGWFWIGSALGLQVFDWIAAICRK